MIGDVKIGRGAHNRVRETTKGLPNLSRTVSRVFTATKDYSPKRQFKNSSHQGIKLTYL